MSKTPITLIDTNIIVRFLIGDGGNLYHQAKEIMDSIESGRLRVHLCESVLAEVVYVLLKVYTVSKKDIGNALGKILQIKSIQMDNKSVALNALYLFVNENVDFVDALLISYNKNTNAAILSFDKKINAKLK